MSDTPRPPTHRDAFLHALRAGAELFNARQFFEAHEVWEEQWRDEDGDERHLLQGLIQVAAGLYKLQLGMPSGTFKLMEKALGHLRAVPVHKAYALQLEPLIAAAERWRDEAKRMLDAFDTRYDVEALPRLEFTPSRR